MAVEVCFLHYVGYIFWKRGSFIEKKEAATTMLLYNLLTPIQQNEWQHAWAARAWVARRVPS